MNRGGRQQRWLPCCPLLASSRAVDVILDANILISDYRLSGVAFVVARDGIKRTSGTLVVPEVALAETVAKFKETLNSAVQRQGEADAHLRRLTGRSPVTTTQIDVAAEVQQYEERLRWALINMNAVVLPWPEVSHESILHRIWNGRRPMRKDVGYRDTLIWEAILAYLRGSQTREAIFVTADSDFCDQNDVHPDLVQDLRDAGLDPSCLVIERSLQALNKRVFEPALARLAEVKERLQRGAGPVDLVAWAGANAHDLVEGEALRGVVVDLPDRCGKISLSRGSQQVKRITVNDVHQLAGGELLVSADVSVEGIASVSLDEFDYESHPHECEQFGCSAGDRWISIDTDASFTVSLDVIVDGSRVVSFDATDVK